MMNSQNNKVGIINNREGINRSRIVGPSQRTTPKSQQNTILFSQKQSPIKGQQPFYNPQLAQSIVLQQDISRKSIMLEGRKSIVIEGRKMSVMPNKRRMNQSIDKSMSELNDTTMMTSQFMTKQQKKAITKTYKLQENDKGEFNLVFDPKHYVCKKLSESDVMDLKRIFDYFDEDGSSTLSPIDIQNLLHAFNMYPDRETLYAIVSGFDQTESGSLTFDDFIRIFIDTPQPSKRQIREIFREYSKIEPGYITLEDLKRVNQDLGEQLQEGQLKQIIQDNDSHRLGKLTLEDFSKAILQMK